MISYTTYDKESKNLEHLRKDVDGTGWKSRYLSENPYSMPNNWLLVLILYRM
jgi:hypothetical protein